jgi:hypothetical protein
MATPTEPIVAPVPGEDPDRVPGISPRVWHQVAPQSESDLAVGIENLVDDRAFGELLACGRRDPLAAEFRLGLPEPELQPLIAGDRGEVSDGLGIGQVVGEIRLDPRPEDVRFHVKPSPAEPEVVLMDPEVVFFGRNFVQGVAEAQLDPPPDPGLIGAAAARDLQAPAAASHRAAAREHRALAGNGEVGVIHRVEHFSPE